MKAIFVIYLFCIGTSLFGQRDFRPGYVVSMDGDTMQGYLDYGNPKSNANFVLFKADSSADQFVKYTADQLSVYRFENSNYYLSKEIIIMGEREKYFLEYLLNGTIDLYFLAHPFKDYFFIQKEGALIELSDEKRVVKVSDVLFVNQYVNPYTGVLNYAMRDAPTLKEDIQALEFNHEDMVDLLEKYHYTTCKPGEECVIFSRNTKSLYDVKWKIRIGIYGGIAFTNREAFRVGRNQDAYYILAENSFGQAEYSTVSDKGGFGAPSPIHMSKGYVYPTLSLHLSQRWRTSGQVDIQYHAYEIQADVNTVATNFLKYIISLNYELYDLKKISPFIRIGASLNQYRYSIKGPSSSVQNVSYVTSIRADTHLNILSGVGVLRKLKSGREIKVEFLYDFNAIKSNLKMSFNKTTSLMLQCGVHI